MMLRVDRRVDVLGRLYAEAEARLQLLIAESVASGSLGTARYRRAQLVRVQELLAALEKEGIPEAKRLVEAGYREGLELAERSGLKGSFSGAHREAVEAIAEGLSTRLVDTRVLVGRRVNDIFRREALRSAALGLLEGSTTRQNSEQLTEALQAQGVKAFRDVTGREWGLAAYATMAIRTTTREAASEGTKNRMLEHGVTSCTISSHATSCPQCLPFDGETFELGELEQLPPFHPNCRHVLTPAARFATPAGGTGGGATGGAGGGAPPGGDGSSGSSSSGDSPDTVRASERYSASGTAAEVAKINAHIAAIERVHRVPASLPVVSIEVVPSIPGGDTPGLTSLGVGRTGVVVRGIRLDRRLLRRDENATVHEIGHTLDVTGLAGPQLDPIAANQLEFASAVDEPAMSAWRDAVEATPTYGRALRGDPQRGYTASWREIFARAYEQWVALRSGDASLREQLERDRQREPDSYWPAQEFSGVAAALDDLFSDRGLVP